MLRARADFGSERFHEEDTQGHKLTHGNLYKWGCFGIRMIRKGCQKYARVDATWCCEVPPQLPVCTNTDAVDVTTPELARANAPQTSSTKPRLFVWL